jgi:putative endonuclease
MYYVYILQSKKDKAMYVGHTSNLRKRLEMHNLGKVFSTKPRKPFALIYYEAHQNKNDALKREDFLKSGWGKNYIKRILKNYLKIQKFRRA